MATVLRLHHFAYAYPGAAQKTLEDVNLEIGSGQCHCLTGDTGSGKTTLALAIKGMLPPGKMAGTVHVAPRPDGRPGAGLVLQNPETQLLAPTVGAEIAFGLENLCVPPANMLPRVMAARDAVGLKSPLHAASGNLSMGQKYRLIVAALLVMNPALLVLDEPSAQLDPEGVQHLADLIRTLKASGVSFLLCEHQPEPLAHVIDACWRLERGVVQSAPAPVAEPQCERAPEPAVARENTVVDTCDLTALRDDGERVWSEVSFSVFQGQRVAVSGPNGGGKTTLLRCLMGFVPPRKGSVRVFGEPPDVRRLRGRVGCLYQNPPRQLFENTVFDEVAFPLKRLGAGKTRAHQVEAALDRCGITNLAACAPHKLSYGQKHLVALASVLAPEPELLLLDDPFAGLDRRWRQTVQHALETMSRATGTTVLWTTHNPQIASAWPHVRLHVEGGRIVPQ